MAEGLWIPGMKTKRIQPFAFIKQRKIVRSFRGRDGKWRQVTIEDTGVSTINHIERDDGNVDAIVAPRTFAYRVEGKYVG